MSTLWRSLPDDAPNDGQQVWVDRGTASGPPFLGVWNLGAGGFISSTNSLLCFWFAVQRWKSQLVVAPMAGYYATGPQGGPFTPTTKTYSIRNLATVSIDWTAIASETWLDISNPGGTLAIGATASTTISFNSAADSLPAGTHTATITITDTTLGASETRDVTLIIT